MAKKIQTERIYHPESKIDNGKVGQRTSASPASNEN